MTDKFGRFTEDARQAFVDAQTEAWRLNHHYIGTEHLLLGLVKGESPILAQLQIDSAKLRSNVEFVCTKGESPVTERIQMTPRLITVIRLAIHESRLLGHHYISSMHLLLGLLREGEGMGAGFLEAAGITLDIASQAVLEYYAEDAKERAYALVTHASSLTLLELWIRKHDPELWEKIKEDSELLTLLSARLISQITPQE